MARGLAQGAEDASHLEVEYQRGAFEIRTPTLTALPAPALLGPGEEESIRLAIELRADWLLVDDLDARRAAERNFTTAGVGTAIQGTLGVIVSACHERNFPRSKAVEMVETIKGRPDIWMSAELCDQVIDGLRQAS